MKHPPKAAISSSGGGGGGPLTVAVNTLSLVHKGSQGVAIATMPDVCNVPTPGGPVPTPFPNIAKSADLAAGSKRVSADGGNSVAIKSSNFAVSSGDEPGTLGGVASGVNMHRATWVSHSVNVNIEGAPACRLTDKMMMNMNNTACMAGEVQAPVIVVLPPVKVKEEPKECVTELLEVTCGHGSRSFQLIWPGETPPAVGVPATVLQVTAPPEESDRISAKISFKKDECMDHFLNPLTVDTAEFDCATRTRLAFDARCDAHYDGILGIRHFWPQPAILSIYTITVNACHPAAAEPVTVEVFPDIQWQASLTLGFQTERKTTEDPPVHESGLVLKGEISVTRGASQLQVELEANAGLMKVFYMLNIFKRFSDYVMKGLCKLGGVELKFLWPTLKLNGSWGYQENPDTNAVEFPVDLTVGLDPLIGIEGKVDILVPLCKLMPLGIGLVVAKLKKAADKGYGQDDDDVKAKATLAIWIQAEAKISGTLAFKQMLGQQEMATSGEVGGEVIVTIEGEVSGEISVFCVKTAAGLKAGGRSKIHCKLAAAGDEEGIFCTGEFGWSGLTFYAVAYANSEFTVGPLKGKGENKIEGTYQAVDPMIYDFNKKKLYIFRE